MPQITEQKHRIEDIKSAQYITGALRDISAIELKNLRKKFEKNHIFFQELQDLYKIVLRIAEEGGHADAVKQKGSESLHIAYTTNKHFYGSLNHNVMKEFMQATNAKDNCLVLGSTGKQIWLTKAQQRKELTFLSFADDKPTDKEMGKFLKDVEHFAHVYVYYPGFVSVFRQDVQMVDITFRPSQEEIEKVADDGAQLAQYLLEPDLSAMAEFFITQVRFALLEQILLETQLSQVSARLVKMDGADQNANKLVKVEQRELRRAFSSFSSRRILETLVGYLQWHKA